MSYSVHCTEAYNLRFNFTLYYHTYAKITSPASHYQYLLPAVGHCSCHIYPYVQEFFFYRIYVVAAMCLAHSCAQSMDTCSMRCIGCRNGRDNILYYGERYYRLYQRKDDEQSVGFLWHGLFTDIFTHVFWWYTYLLWLQGRRGDRTFISTTFSTCCAR